MECQERKRPRPTEFHVAYNAQNRLRLASKVGKSDGPFRCVLCDDEMILRQGMKNAWLFAHKGAYAHDTGGGESYIHCYAKCLISSNIQRWTFTDNCSKCSTHLQTHRFLRAKDEVPFDEFRLDVAAFNDDGSIVAAIEVFHTHAVGPDKRARLEHKDLVVIEVAATDVIEAAEADDFSVRTICTQICDGCIRRAVDAEARRQDQCATEARMAAALAQSPAEKQEFIRKEAELHDREMARRAEAAAAVAAQWQEMMRLHAIDEATAAAERAEAAEQAAARERRQRADNDARLRAEKREQEIQRLIGLETDFMSDALLRDRIYLAVPQHRKDEAAGTRLHWDPRADWDNPAVAPRLTPVRPRHVRPCGSFWATVADALQLMPFWRPEFVPFAATVAAAVPLAPM